MSVSFPNRLILIIIVTILFPTVMINLMSFSYIKREMQADAASWLQGMTVNTGETMNSYTQLLIGLTKNPAYDYTLMNIFEQHLHNREGLFGYSFEDKSQINGWLSMLLETDRNNLVTVELLDRNGNRFRLGQDIRISDADWMQAAKKLRGGAYLAPPVKDESGMTVFSVSRLLYNPQTFHEIGLIRIFFRLEILSGAYNELTQRGGTLYLVDQQGKVLYDVRHQCTDTLLSSCIGPDHFQSRYLSRATDWSLVGTIPKSELFLKINRIQEGIMLVNIFLFVLSLLVVVGVSHQISRPIKRLSRMMQTAPRVYFRIEVPESKRKDEIGMIMSSFRTMVGRIHELISEVTQTEQGRKRSEIAALQAQINPHFLNNTLSAIAMKAELDGNYDISGMASELGKLLRYAIGQEREWVDVKRECDYIRLYVQVMRYRYPKVELDLQAAEEVMHWRMIKLLLQPIVENAILHGLVPDGQQGTIRIRIMPREDAPVQGLMITVEDNGVGMDEDQIAGMKASMTGMNVAGKESLGIRNVYERIKLAYGEGRVRFDIESGPECGTRFTIELPRVSNENLDRG